MKHTVVIEIPKGSNIKYEYNPKTGRYLVDRILFGAHVYPHNYGFFENTLDWDGDALDAFVISNHSFPQGVEVPVRIIGVLHMIDAGETDSKILTVIDSDPRFKHVNDIKDIPQHLLDEAKDFFETYKNLQKKKVQITGIGGKDEAMKEMNECIDLYNKYHSMDKDEFIAKMKKEHPNKYTN